MKFVLTFTPHEGGSEQERYESARRAQMLLQKWEPAKSANIREWVTRCDGQGGFAVLETDNEQDLLRDLALWSSFLRFEVYPVVDNTIAVPLTTAAIQAREALNA